MTPADQLVRIEADTTVLREALERIKASPELCSQFLGVCARLRALEKEVRLAALGFLEAGQPVPSVELNEGRLSSVVHAETILELARDPDVRRQLSKLTAFIEAVCPVREAVYFNFCRKLGIKPSSAHVHRTRGQPFVIYKSVGLWGSGRRNNART
jgi:hypothetical protein